MNIIDTHTHLYLDQFKQDIDNVISRAKENGVKKFVFPAIDSSHFDSMHNLKNKYPNEIYLMFWQRLLTVIVRKQGDLKKAKKHIYKCVFFFSVCKHG